jgi:hypothetical protein
MKIYSNSTTDPGSRFVDECYIVSSDGYNNSVADMSQP